MMMIEVRWALDDDDLFKKKRKSQNHKKKTLPPTSTRRFGVRHLYTLDPNHGLPPPERGSFFFFLTFGFSLHSFLSVLYAIFESWRDGITQRECVLMIEFLPRVCGCACVFWIHSKGGLPYTSPFVIFLLCFFGMGWVVVFHFLLLIFFFWVVVVIYI